MQARVGGRGPIAVPAPHLPHVLPRCRLPLDADPLAAPSSRAKEVGILDLHHCSAPGGAPKFAGQAESAMHAGSTNRALCCCGPPVAPTPSRLSHWPCQALGPRAIKAALVQTCVRALWQRPAGAYVCHRAGAQRARRHACKGLKRNVVLPGAVGGQDSVAILQHRRTGIPGMRLGTDVVRKLSAC